MIVQKELERDEVVEIANEILAGLSPEITQIQNTLGTHETRLEALESSNPEALRSLTDVNLGTLDSGANGKVLFYEHATDSFRLKIDEGGIPDVPDAQTYVRSAGVWTLLSSELSGLELKNLGDVNPNLNPSSGQVLTYNGVVWTNLDPAGGIPEAPIDSLLYARKDEAWEEVKDYRNLSLLEDVNLGTLANGDVLTYDLANSEWVNSGLSLTPATLEYFQIRTTSGTGQYGPNTTGEFGVSSALNVFGAAIVGTNLIDQTHSTNIITITNGK